VAEEVALISEMTNYFDDPTTIEEAKARSDWPKWKEAMNEEMNRLKMAKTWEKKPLPTDHKAIACRWVYHLKTDNTGKIAKYKPRLVAKGFTQIPGINFFDTYAPVLISRHCGQL